MTDEILAAVTEYGVFGEEAHLARVLARFGYHAGPTGVALIQRLRQFPAYAAMFKPVERAGGKHETRA